MRMCPCKGCGERTAEPNCHEHCPVSARGEWGYEQWKAEKEAANEARRKELDVYGYQSDRSDRMTKQMKWKAEGQR